MSTTISVPAPSSQSGADYRYIQTTSLKSWEVDGNAPPLTTIFTYKPSCIGRWLVPNDNAESKTVYSIYPEGGPISDREYINCQPFGNYGSYSPAVCPDHQELAGINELRFVTSGTSSIRWDGACCPRGLRLVDEILGPICSGTFTTPFQAFAPITGASSATIISSGITSINTTRWTSYFPGQDAGNITTISSAVVTADPLFVGWQESDLPRLPPAYASSLAKRIGVPFTPTATPGSASSLPSQTTSSLPATSLSTGAKAGIGVGVTIGALLIVALIAFLILRRRSKNRKRTPPGSQDETRPEMEDQDASLATRKWFLRGKWRSEVETPKNQPGELDSRGVRIVGGPPQELDGTSNVNR